MQTAFTNNSKLDSKHSIQTSNSNHSLSLSITASELEDENEESETENLFYVISFIASSFNNYYSNYTSNYSFYTSKSHISDNGIYKLNNCFRI